MTNERVEEDDAGCCSDTHDTVNSSASGSFSGDEKEVEEAADMNHAGGADGGVKVEGDKEEADNKSSRSDTEKGRQQGDNVSLDDATTALVEGDLDLEVEHLERHKHVVEVAIAELKTEFATMLSVADKKPPPKGDDIPLSKDELVGEIASLARENHALKRTLKNIPRRITAEMDDIFEENDDLQGQIESLKNMNNALRASVKQVTKERDVLKDDLDRQQEEFDPQIIEMRIERVKAGLNKQLEEAEGKRDHLLKEVDKLRNQLEEAQTAAEVAVLERDEALRDKEDMAILVHLKSEELEDLKVYMKKLKKRQKADAQKRETAMDEENDDDKQDAASTSASTAASTHRSSPPDLPASPAPSSPKEPASPTRIAGRWGSARMQRRQRQQQEHQSTQPSISTDRETNQESRAGGVFRRFGWNQARGGQKQADTTQDENLPPSNAKKENNEAALQEEDVSDDDLPYIPPPLHFDAVPEGEELQNSSDRRRLSHRSTTSCSSKVSSTSTSSTLRPGRSASSIDQIRSAASALCCQSQPFQSQPYQQDEYVVETKAASILGRRKKKTASAILRDLEVIGTDGGTTETTSAAAAAWAVMGEKKRSPRSTAMW